MSGTGGGASPVTLSSNCNRLCNSEMGRLKWISVRYESDFQSAARRTAARARARTRAAPHHGAPPFQVGRAGGRRVDAGAVCAADADGKLGRAGAAGGAALRRDAGDGARAVGAAGAARAAGAAAAAATSVRARRSGDAGGG